MDIHLKFANLDDARAAQDAMRSHARKTHLHNDVLCLTYPLNHVGELDVQGPIDTTAREGEVAVVDQRINALVSHVDPNPLLI